MGAVTVVEIFSYRLWAKLGRQLSTTELLASFPLSSRMGEIFGKEKVLRQSPEQGQPQKTSLRTVIVVLWAGVSHWSAVPTAGPPPVYSLAGQRENQEKP